MLFPPRDIVYFLLLFLLLPPGLRSYAQSLFPESPVSSSLSNSLIASTASHSFALNPSQLRADSLHNVQAAIAYSPFVGGLKEASQSAAEAIYFAPLVSSSFGLGITGLSYADLYSDLSLYISFAKSFPLTNNREAAAGLRLRYETLGTTAEYPKLHFFFIDVGFTMDLTPEFSLGATALNLLGEKYEIVNGETENLDRRFLLGIAYKPLEIPIRIFTSLEEQQSIPLNIGFGTEYDPLSFIALRLGTATDLGNITAGVGIVYGNFSFDAGSRFDKSLGPVFSFSACGIW